MQGTDEADIRFGLLKTMREAHSNSIERGFWATVGRFGDRNEAEMVALMHSELSELLEAIRKPGPDSHCPEFTGKEVELADVIIRICDYAAHFAPHLPNALIAKMAYNRTRPYKHGKKF